MAQLNRGLAEVVPSTTKLLRRQLVRLVAFLMPHLVTDAFNYLFFTQPADGPPWHRTHWRGTAILKCPTDLWAYHEIIHETRPDLIIETGSWYGGSSHYLATQLELLGEGRVISIDDVECAKRPRHPRLDYWLGSSTDPELFSRIEIEARRSSRVMVILDSDHSRRHVARELALYHRLVTPGCFLVVEDTCVNGNPVMPEHGPGPMEAVDEFLAGHQDFKIDSVSGKFLLSFNPRGYLRRKPRGSATS